MFGVVYRLYILRLVGVQAVHFIFGVVYRLCIYIWCGVQAVYLYLVWPWVFNWPIDTSCVWRQRAYQSFFSRHAGWVDNSYVLLPRQATTPMVITGTTIKGRINQKKVVLVPGTGTPVRTRGYQWYWPR